MKKKNIFVFILIAIAAVLYIIANKGLSNLANEADTQMLAQQIQQLDPQLRFNANAYLLKHSAPPQNPNPFMQEGMFPQLSLTCDKQANMCSDQRFLYTGKCNAETCLLNIVYAEEASPQYVATHGLDFMITLQAYPQEKRVCFYNSKLGRQVCKYLEEQGWPIRQLLAE